MRNLNAELSYFRHNLDNKYKDLLMQEKPLPADAIQNEWDASPFAKILSDEERAFIITELEHNYAVSHPRGTAVVKDFKPWLANKKNSEGINFYYWDRLRNYYLSKDIIPPNVVATTDKVTDELLDFLGDPEDASTGGRRGMAIGHVQSGKTTNYSALICKAADAGYKVIILLAGITNSLRAQTQERLDETFIGKKSVFGAVAVETLPIHRYATDKRFPAYGTSRDRDFTRDAAGVYFSIAAHNEPIIFITKKNRAPLERLRDWLKEQGAGDRLNLPMLLVDDEADNASINTQKDPSRTTAINGVIRELLALFPRSAYIGYTATPFANIFIDPDTVASMKNDDLFPKHFIKALDAPSNYVGAHRVFANDGDLRDSMVKIIDDFANILPLDHKKGDTVASLPESLLHAIRVFCLTRAIRILRGQDSKHCSMMINVSRFNDIQDKVYGLVYKYLTTLKNSITVNAGLDIKKITDPDMRKLHESFDEEFSDLPETYEKVLKVLPQAVASIQTITVNMKGGALDYSANKEKGLHVIAIGGLALSRGLTLEDLTVSYILRNAAASDTLMQMARWFGYRKGFEDICRLYLPAISDAHYGEVHTSIEELRSEVHRMHLLKLTPEHFGLKVRESPLAMRITAANKMRTAAALTLGQDYSALHIEGYVLENSDAVNKKNLKLIEDFISELGDPINTEQDLPNLIWNCKGTEVLDVLNNFRFSEAHPDLAALWQNRNLLSDYISDRLGSELSDWNVALVQNRPNPKEQPVNFAGHSITLRSRNSGEANAETYRINGRKNRIADPNDAKLAIGATAEKLIQAELSDPNGARGDKAYNLHREKPLLIVHLFKGQAENLAITGTIVTLSFCLPTTHLESISRGYQVNIVYQRQMQVYQPEPDDDELILEDAQNVN